MLLTEYDNTIREWFESDPGFSTGPMDEEEILLNEEKIGLSFCQSYKAFLREYGSGLVDAYYIHGKPANSFMGGHLKSVMEKTKFYKEAQRWPGIEDWYIISDDGRGNPIGIDPEGKVWLSDHDAGFEKVKLADNFEEFLHKLLTDTLYE